MREPYPLALVPLFPQFLGRRRAKSDFSLRAMEKLGLDRPAYIWVIDLGIQDPRGARPEDIGNSTYRTSDEHIRASFAAAESAGLATSRDGRWSLTEAGRTAVDEHRRAMEAHYASLSPIAAPDLERLATLLDSALTAALASPEPKTRDHARRAARYRWKEPSSALARLDAAIYGLWQFRDDCHVQAWRDAGLEGPLMPLLTAAWQKEAATDDDLVPKIGAQRPEDVRAGLHKLRGIGLLTSGPELALTDAGKRKRDAVEASTDRYFFGPWPEDVGAQAAWIAERLAAVNAALA